MPPRNWGSKLPNKSYRRILHAGCENIENENKKSTKMRLVKFAGYILVAASFAFLIYIIWNYKNKFSFSVIKNPPAAIAYFAAIAFGFVMVVYVSSFAWKQILEFIHGKKIPYNEIRGVYVQSNIGKYLPGGVMHFAGRNLLGSKLGFKQIDMAFSTVTEVITLLITACAWGLILAWSSFAKAMSYALQSANILKTVLLFAAAVMVLAVGIFFVVKKGYVKQYKRLFTKGFIFLFLRLIAIYSITMLVPGVFLALLFTQVLGAALTANTFILIIAAYVMSWAIGYIVPGAPGGIGIREAVIILILGSICPKEIIIAATVLHRVASILGDVLAFGIESLIQLIVKKV